MPSPKKDNIFLFKFHIRSTIFSINHHFFKGRFSWLYHWIYFKKYVNLRFRELLINFESTFTKLNQFQITYVCVYIHICYLQIDQLHNCHQVPELPHTYVCIHNHTYLYTINIYFPHLYTSMSITWDTNIT